MAAKVLTVVWLRTFTHSLHDIAILFIKRRLQPSHKQDTPGNSTVTDCGVCSCWPWQTKTTIVLLLTVESAADLGRPKPQFYCCWLWSLQMTLADQDHNSTVTDCGVRSWPWQTKTTILLLLNAESADDLDRPRPQFYCYWLWSP
jgi:hypothetical protein